MLEQNLRTEKGVETGERNPRLELLNTSPSIGNRLIRQIGRENSEEITYLIFHYCWHRYDSIKQRRSTRKMCCVSITKHF